MVEGGGRRGEHARPKSGVCSCQEKAWEEGRKPYSPTNVTVPRMKRGPPVASSEQDWQQWGIQIGMHVEMYCNRCTEKERVQRVGVRGVSPSRCHLRVETRRKNEVLLLLLLVPFSDRVPKCVNPHGLSEQLAEGT